jgi:hypothetical protein
MQTVGRQTGLHRAREVKRGNKVRERRGKGHQMTGGKTFKFFRRLLAQHHLWMLKLNSTQLTSACVYVHGLLDWDGIPHKPGALLLRISSP